MIVKRLVLGFLTLLAIARVFLSLTVSFSEPQIQGRLELYQTNLVLYASQLKLEPENEDLNKVISSALGEEPNVAALEKYQENRQTAAIAKENLQTQLDQLTQIIAVDNQSDVSLVETPTTTTNVSPQAQQLQKQIAGIKTFIDEIDLKQGILLAKEGKITEALATWEQLITSIDEPDDEYSQTAIVLTNLWQESSQVIPHSQDTIEYNLDSWFRDQSLEKLYQVSNEEDKLALLQEQEQLAATNALFKLALISGIPVLGGFSGIVLLIFLLVQLFVKQENSILATNSNKTWNTPWNWEITWQVLIVGFFFVGQFVLPLFLGIVGINVAGAGLRTKALYVLCTYILMAIGGIGVLYYSIKSYFPLPNDWFKVKLFDNWIFWGFGGYLLAVPAVLFVSLINQQIWQGQGGSNPLLSLALQAQDRVALLIFFVTASIAAPVFEEIMFRGFLLPSLTRYLSVSTAIVISGFIFAIAHLSLSEVLPLTTLGIILGAVYTRSRNILAPMLLHSLWNSGTLLSLFILGSPI
ncbi:putative metal-dependent membrane protease [Xenococcus sp. PCC 7305]|uniref:CPBP family glutamic-type intramembrane protease n=1 Tax=Xenococcus sp. PCC 7305 TaxID=102125 RepID=UPI0002ABE3D4|nr:CPBP family glutamic-type intramembrane protease [Xenococcus sp. PCC 7305]ELS01931.1 putative metal-dependent membrane protease [Xenococcus sp. PCC 7305]